MIDHFNERLSGMDIETVSNFLQQLEQMRDMEAIEIVDYLEMKTKALEFKNQLDQEVTIPSE